MRTNVVIDDELMAEAMKASGLPTKRATIEAALRLLIQREQQKGILELFGKLHWEGDLAEMRRDRLDYDAIWADKPKEKPRRRRSTAAKAALP